MTHSLTTYQRIISWLAVAATLGLIITSIRHYWLLPSHVSSQCLQTQELDSMFSDPELCKSIVADHLARVDADPDAVRQTHILFEEDIPEINNGEDVLDIASSDVEDDYIESSVSYNEYDDLYVLAHLLMGECANCDYELKLMIGSVVVNRVNSEWFPDTYYEVAFQSGQYQCTWGGGYYQEPNDECWEVAKELLEKGSNIPGNVVWQAEFPQGDGVYMQVGNQYLCWKGEFLDD